MHADNSNIYYDINYDAVLIEQSIAKQYGILPSEQGNLSWSDWSKMVGGLMDDTPLGRMVALRMESDSDVLRKLTPEQKQARAAWASFKMQQKNADPTAEKALRAQMAQLQAALKAAFYHPEGR